METLIGIFDPRHLASSLTPLAVALFLGMLIGFERILAHKTAGPRTHALVSMGSALFIIIGQEVASAYSGTTGLDPLRIASQIVVGVGFLGAGMIIFKDSHLQGLTTASGLWVAAGIGVAAGFRLYDLAVMATILTLFIFTVLWYFESRVKRFERTD